MLQSNLSKSYSNIAMDIFKENSIIASIPFREYQANEFTQDRAFNFLVPKEMELEKCIKKNLIEKIIPDIDKYIT